MINLERPPNPQRPLSFVESEAAPIPLVGAAPEVMMKYIESLDGPGEGIFQNNRIAQLKPNCPPFVTVCPGCNSQGAHLLTEDTTGRLFSQLVTTIGPSCPASCLLLLQEDVREKRIFSSAKTETERQALAAFSRHSAHRTFLAGHEQNRGCGQPSNDWMEPSIQIQKLERKDYWMEAEKIGRRLE